MRRSLVALMPAAVGLLISACVGDRATTAPRATADGAALLAAARPVTCSFTQINKDAGNYFASKQDVVYDIIKSMQSAYNLTGAAGATPYALDIYHQVEISRFGSRIVTGAEVAGGIFASDVALCTTLGTLDATAAGNALTNGIFAVRGTANDPSTAALALPQSYPWWGVEPRFSSTWPTSPYSRYLIYAFPGVALVTLGGEQPAVPTFVGYNVSSLPAVWPKDGLRVGVCVLALKTDPTTRAHTAVNLLIHDGVVVANSAPYFCDGAPLASLSTSTWFASITHRITSVFGTKSLYAQDRSLDDASFTGGGPSSWSPMPFGQITGSNIALTFTTQPSNGTAFNTLNPFVVHAATPYHALEGVSVAISVANNSGVPAGACVIGTLTGTTDSNGNVTFNNVTVLKAGGYTITASGVYQTVPTLSGVSNLFNVKNGKGTTTCQ